jgi:hypothetical protein
LLLDIPGYLRAALRLLLPVNTEMPKRYWRWTWLAMAVRLLIGIPFLVICIGPYLAAKGLVWVLDAGGGWLGMVTVACFNRDLRNSGWQPAVRRAPAVQLNDRWQERLGDRA